MSAPDPSAGWQSDGTVLRVQVNYDMAGSDCTHQGPVSHLLRHIEHLPRSTKAIQLHIEVSVTRQAAIPIVEACLGSRTATKLEVMFVDHNHRHLLRQGGYTHRFHGYSAETLTSWLDAAVGANSDPNLLDFSLDIPCFHLNEVQEALEAALPHLSPCLQKLQLVFSHLFLLEGRDSIPPFQTAILAALDNNTEPLNLHTFDLGLKDTRDGSELIDQATKQRFHDFGVTKSMQWSKATTEDQAFRLEHLPKALELVEGNPHLDSLHSLSMVFHCLRSDADARHILEAKASRVLKAKLERSANKRKREDGSESP